MKIYPGEIYQFDGEDIGNAILFIAPSNPSVIEVLEMANGLRDTSELETTVYFDQRAFKE